jgi:hypothetical protein
MGKRDLMMVLSTLSSKLRILEKTLDALNVSE